MIDLILGNCLDILEELEENTYDTLITDPNYGLGKKPDAFKMLKAWMQDQEYTVNGGGFMGKEWDSFVPGPHYWKAVYRVLKPGAIGLVFGGTRTYDLTTLALRLAGFEIRDCINWLYGSGFPKSHDIGKAIDKAKGKKRKTEGHYVHPDGKLRPNSHRSTGNVYGEHKGALETPCTIPATSEAETWDGWGTALKPAWEPIIVVMKPLDGTFVNNALTHGVAGLWIDGGRIATKTAIESGRGKRQFRDTGIYGRYEGQENREYQSTGRWPANLILSHTPECRLVGTRKVKGSQLNQTIERSKSNSESIGKQTDSYCQGYTDENGLEEVEHWECSEDCPVRMLDEQSGERPSTGHYTKSLATPETKRSFMGQELGSRSRKLKGLYAGDSGGASRFFYCAKASKRERNEGLEHLEKRTKVYNGKSDQSSEDMKPVEERWTTSMQNIHPTVKPIELMRYLCRLTKTPFGGIILDPFMGSGPTGIAAILEGRDFLGIEMMPEYFEIAEARINYWANKVRQLEMDLK